MSALKKNTFLLVLCIIFIIALGVRLYNLSSFPVGFHIDEASLGYNAYSLLKTGRDDNNNPFPLYIEMFGDNRPTGYHYITIPSIVLFGLNEFATRFPSALFGALLSFVGAFFVMVILKDKKTALLTALFLAFSPWSFVLSRASAEGVVALFLILLGFTLLFYAIQIKKGIPIFFSVIFLSLSFFFYHTPRVFVPATYFVFCFFLYPEIKKLSQKVKISIAIGFLYLCFVSVLLVFFIGGGTGRYNQVNIFNFPETKLVMEEQIREDGTLLTPVWESRLFHNKVVNFSFTYVTNYLEYFSGEFLFIQGGLPRWYKIPNSGLFFLVLLPFLLIGIVQLAFRKDRLSKVPLVWLVLGPIVAAVTSDDIPNINRAIVMFPMIEIISIFGFIHSIYRLKTLSRYVLIGAFTGLYIWSVCYFFHQYFIHGKTHQTWYRDNGVKEMIQKTTLKQDQYEGIVIGKGGGGIYPLVLFFTQYDPASYQQAGSPKDKEYTGFGKFIFVPQGCPSVDKDDRFPRLQKIIFIDKGDCKEQPQDQREREYIYREDGTRAFRIVYQY